jgi:hypothetical protein
MERIGLLPPVRAAVVTWSHRRRHYRAVRRWMAGGRVTFSAEPKRDVAPASGPWALLPNLLRWWVGQGIDELLIAPRSLHGLTELERDPQFWTPDGPERVIDLMHSRLFDRSPGASDAAPEADVRYAGFSRYDEFHARGGQVTLANGWAHHLMDDLLPVLAAALRRPWTAAVTSDTPDVAPGGRRCTISRQPTACGVTVHPHGLGIRFDYDVDHG